MADKPENGKSGWDTVGDIFGKIAGGAIEYFTMKQEQEYNRQSMDLQKYGTSYNPYYAQSGGSGGSYSYGGGAPADLMKWFPLILIGGVGLILVLKA
jgi:hypothetical protein